VIYANGFYSAAMRRQRTSETKNGKKEKGQTRQMMGPLQAKLYKLIPRQWGHRIPIEQTSSKCDRSAKWRARI